VLREQDTWKDGQGKVWGRRMIERGIGQFDRSRDIHTFYDPTGKKVLDYGCGPGDLARRLVERGAGEVVGIDISEAEIEEARARAAAAGMADRARFLVADAHRTGLPDSSFELILGIAILHHLELEKALAEIRRLLQPGGRAVFMEPLWHNPVLRLGRALTPAAREVDEHPLTEQDWKTCAAAFPRFRHFERELTTVPLMPLNLVLPAAWQRRLARRLHALDERLLARWPSLGKHCRITFLVLE
jgi:ubiquinone/menaquinone biosynthesis C-methylase UbiE